MQIRGLAVATAVLGVGNCEAQASLAFDYLARFRTRTGGRFPIELWEFGTADGDDAHVVVVIGRQPADASEPAGWNRDAVICDPWSDTVLTAAESGPYLTGAASPIYAYTNGNPTSRRLFRLEGNAPWPWATEPDASGVPIPNIP